MAGVKSILDIDVNDEGWQKFQSSWEKYNGELAKQPATWANVGKLLSAASTQMERMASAVKDQNAAAQGQKENDQRQLKHLTQTTALWSNISKSSASLYRNVVGIGESVLKWGERLTGFGGAIIAGTIGGFDRVAEGVAGTRQEALGLGTNIGGLRAFKIDMKRFLNDPDSFLARISAMESDVTQRTPWYEMMHGRAMTGDPVKDAAAFMTAVRAWALRTPPGLLQTQANALQLGIPLDELKTWRRTHNDEWQKQMAALGPDTGRLNLSDATAKQNADYLNVVHRNLSSVGTEFDKQITRMMPWLAKTSTTWALGANIILKSAGDAIANASADVNKKGLLGAWLDFDEWQARGYLDVAKAAGGAVGQLGESAAGAAGRLGKSAWTRARDLVSGWGHAVASSTAFNSFADAVQLVTRAYGLPAGMMEAVKLQESGTALENVGRSAAGAVGPWQDMPGTSRALGINPYDLMSSTKGTGVLLRQLLDHFHGNVAAALAAYNIRGGQGRIDALMKEFKGAWGEHLPAETARYVATGLDIMVTNATGGAATIAVNQTAGH
jgi:hypothetical protein